MTTELGTRKTRRSVTAALMLAAVVALVATPALAIDISHSTHRATVAQAAWGTTDPERFTGDFGLVYATREGDWTGIGYYAEDTVAVDCGDGTMAPFGTITVGHGPADTLSVAPNLSSAVASGTVQLMTFTYDGCSGSGELLGQSTVHVSITLAASGRRETTIDRYTDAVNGEYRFTSMTRISARSASGTVLVDGAPITLAAAQIATHSSSNTFVGH